MKAKLVKESLSSFDGIKIEETISAFKSTINDLNDLVQQYVSARKREKEEIEEEYNDILESLSSQIDDFFEETDYKNPFFDIVEKFKWEWQNELLYTPW